MPTSRTRCEGPTAKLLRHVGDHVGLADGLAAGDRQRLVRIGRGGKRRIDEILARHLVHGAQHGLVDDPAAAQRQQEFHTLDALVSRPFGHRDPPRASRYLYFAGKISASLVMNGSSVRSSRSGVTEMRLSLSADRSVPLRPVGCTPRANAIQ